MTQIKNRYSGIIICSGNMTLKDLVQDAVRKRIDLSDADLGGADLGGAYLGGAYLSCANLSGAYLNCANLNGADLSRADLSGAYLNGADLNGADLNGADLSRAKGINKWRSTTLQFLFDQPGKIRAYKLVTAEGEGPYKGGIKYQVGKSYAIPDANTDDSVECGAGINLATMDWCLTNWKATYRILIAEFVAADIAAIPISGNGKFRVHRCTIVGEKDPKELGLIEKPPSTEKVSE